MAIAPRSLRDPQRLWDLVRYMRGELHLKELITDDEYSELAKDHAAVVRLEADDALRLTGAIAEERSKTQQLQTVRQPKEGQHERIIHTGCEIPDCNICDGGLFVCKYCGKAEIELSGPCTSK